MMWTSVTLLDGTGDVIFVAPSTSNTAMPADTGCASDAAPAISSEVLKQYASYLAAASLDVVE